MCSDITGRRAEAVEKAASEHTSKLDGSLIALQGDVTSKSDLSRIASEISSREGGKLHVLVNNAGIAGSQGAKTKLDVGNVDAEQYAAKHLESETLEGWNKVFETNVAGVFFTTMSLLPLLVAGNASPPQCCLETGSDDKLRPWHASIINITSISGQVKTNQNHYAYNASKASATHLTQMLSHELRFHAGFGVRVNAIAPGVFPSEMTTDTSGNDPKGAGMTHPETGKLREMAGPPGRPGTEEEMVRFFVCCERCRQ